MMEFGKQCVSGRGDSKIFDFQSAGNDLVDSESSFRDELESVVRDR